MIVNLQHSADMAMTVEESWCQTKSIETQVTKGGSKAVWCVKWWRGKQIPSMMVFVTMAPPHSPYFILSHEACEVAFAARYALTV